MTSRQGYNPNRLLGAEFTLAIGCKLDCHYCPQEKLIRRYVDLYGKNNLFMSFNTFIKCLEKFEYGAVISFAGMVEPFHNKDCAKMIRYAYDQGFKILLSTTLVGASEDDFELLKDVRFEDIQLHIPDKKGNSKFVISKEYLSIFSKFHDYFLSNGHLVYSCHGEIHDEIKPYLSNDVICSSAMLNRAGNLEFEDLRVYNHEGRIMCSNSTVQNISGWSPSILPNGTILLCCMDYGMEHILGNLATQEWSEISNGKEYMRFKHGLQDESIPLLCRKCPSACPADASTSSLSDKNLYAANAIKVAQIIKGYVKGELSESILRERFSARSVNVVKTIAKTIKQGGVYVSSDWESFFRIIIILVFGIMWFQLMFFQITIEKSGGRKFKE